MASAYKPLRVRLGTLTVNFAARRALGERLGYLLAGRGQIERFVIENGLGALDGIFTDWHAEHPDSDHPTVEFRAHQRD